MLLGVGLVAFPAHGSSRIQRGAAIAPVPLGGGCNACHTVPSYASGGNPFLGEPKQINTQCYLAGGALFGPFRSPNLTPDAEGLPAGRTLDQFRS
jgi:hypothetical protein